MVTSEELRNAALGYAELGYRVFPCVPNDKNPLIDGGFHAATTDPNQIERWWQTYPRANIGIATEGMLVIDIDGTENRWPHDPEWAAQLAEAGAVALTPRGGRHHLFRMPPEKSWRCSSGQLAPKVDIRADGGYIVVAPSKTKDGPYVWLESLQLDTSITKLVEPPVWLAEAVDRLHEASRTPVAKPPSVNEDREDGGQILPDGNPIPEGQRNATLARLGGAMRRFGLSAEEILAALDATNRLRCRPPLSDREVARIAKSVGRYAPDEVSVALAENHYDQIFNPPRENPARDPGPFPEHLLHVPGFIERVMEFTLATSFRPQPVLALGAALAMLATLTGRKVRDVYNTRTNLYCLGVCPTGGGKERARLVSKELLFLAGADRLIGPEGLASHAGLITAVEQQPALLLQLDEIGRLIRTLGNPSCSPHLYHIATNLMKLFTSSSSVYIGDAYADASQNRIIHQPHACMWGTTVPTSLFEGFTTENITDGFLSRVMIFEAPNDLPPKRKPATIPMPEPLVEEARWWANYQPSGNLNNQHPKPAIVPMSDEAERITDRFDAEADEQMVNLGEPFGSLWSRATEKARKLAILYACSRNAETPEIDAAAAEWACALSRYLSRRMVYLTNRWVAETPFDARRRRVLRIISDAGELGITQTDLCLATRSLTPRERAEVIEALLENGEIRESKTNPGRKGGRPRITYLLA
ncbi:bifunctional DNA primase/polymerase [Tuwongella immobilis]|uniref:DNA primase/polymerase bifunctional N-terminal domain-containing protein n=1 Tax=Tuwongella immobilis TaxID=692036 RepID=A0A6C2YPY6_9BACT|nr:bifunctional DNA primase/polymerase [Tuwongella immobilis]VIP03085.1 Bifunctional DNA primase/polymerase OS=Planctomyces brasiliensis (strain ATCC 49424 / DSM 5305 / JCM 21570 / NBRC 103401 / IFAM 1448) GN=Plabr_0200 PE=4 SV=1: Prim-Pol: PriCT_1: DUF3987 [Tuwongella immobilis]VTS03342.1 Bifunctional DNA primase/polymerase OS=Planctomyces brasiliensis (strain ATCC 49424 / DSM 5305 / JCM 21570 / NBRC 103401 / IFAM 1448) GN=Plabr_0200 PE=4 SV=1: Prim-Pol: PriCT_1: DUF3987 [Tuwongella immobilis]